MSNIPGNKKRNKTFDVIKEEGEMDDEEYDIN
jgi:hypothetical protein